MLISFSTNSPIHHLIWLYIILYNIQLYSATNVVYFQPDKLCVMIPWYIYTNIDSTAAFLFLDLHNLKVSIQWIFFNWCEETKYTSSACKNFFKKKGYIYNKIMFYIRMRISNERALNVQQCIRKHVYISHYYKYHLYKFLRIFQ